MNHLIKITLAIALIALAGCGETRMTRPYPAPAECDLLSAPSGNPHHLTIALLDEVDPQSAPWGSTPSEQLVFHHLYETLITVDCLGKVTAGLAASWRRRDGGRRWTFELREDARFWDGTSVTARDVIACWQDALTLHTGVDSASVDGEKRVDVFLRKRSRNVPRAIAARAFAITKPTDSDWRLGTGLYRIEDHEPRNAAVLNPNANKKQPAVQFIPTSVRDARDLVDSAIDMMVTDDPAALDYAATQSQFDVIALPWDRTHVLLATSRVAAMRRAQSTESFSTSFLDGLARDAVRGDARGHRQSGWWDALDSCFKKTADRDRRGNAWLNTNRAGDTHRILYDEGDLVARDLAERIVALAANDTDTSTEAAELRKVVPGLAGFFATVAVGLPSQAFDASLGAGGDLAYIVAIKRQTPLPCHEANELIARAPWLAVLGDGFPSAMVPLVDTRKHAIVRKDRIGLAVDWYGNLLITNGLSK